MYLLRKVWTFNARGRRRRDLAVKGKEKKEKRVMVDPSKRLLA